MWRLFLKEVNSFFNNPTGYLIACVFLISLGLIVWVFPGTSVLEYGYADLEPLFSYTPFVFVFLVPAVTMKMLAEEKKSGTWELLKTSPLKDYQIVLAKYLAALLLILFILLPTLVYYYSVVQLGEPVGNIDSAGFFGSYIGLFMVAAVFSAIGIFSSALVPNQIVSFVIGVFMSFLFYGGLAAVATLYTGDFGLWLEELSLSFHYDQMGRGVIDSSNLFYFTGMVITWLVLTWILVAKQ
jgi:ABC-2 type transport system permease protein